jgi:hypothetical protein
MAYIRPKKFSLGVTLMIYECKERYPAMSPEEVAGLLDLQYEGVLKLFNEGEIEVPSKINYDGRRKKKIHDRPGLLLRRWESPFHERVS